MSQTYEITGTVKVIEDEQTFASGFSKREFVITTVGDRYPQDIKLEMVKEKCAELDQLEIGDPVTVEFNIRGNEWKDKYYVNLQAWRLKKGDQDPNDLPVNTDEEEPAPTLGEDVLPGDDELDDNLPF
tara:strand:+ start:168 stop:551 length:384 start_codon:yes stop_codon:yes gene_type:complete